MKTTAILNVAFRVTLCSMILLTIVQCSSDSKSSEPVDPRPSFYDLLHKVPHLDLTIQTNYDRLIEMKDEKENFYQDATLTASSNDSEVYKTNIEVRSRGVTRKSMCDYPPLMIKIKKEARESLDIKKSDNIKLVSFCKTDETFHNLVSKEYLVYKLYNVLTDTSYKAKFANISLVDSLGSSIAEDQLGFLIEPTDVMADRLSCTYNEDDKSPIKRIHKEQYKNFVVFQYMVGNTDWNLSGRHNIRMLECDSEKGPKPVPYDFDYSGLVNASYARPHPMLPIKKVTDRLFQFKGSVDEDFSATYSLFNERKDQFYAVVDEFSHINDEVKSEMKSFMDQFYVNINSADVMREEMMKVRKKKK